MQELINCFTEEFKDIEFSSMKILPSHSVRYTKDGLVENIITLTVCVYTSTHELVGKRIFMFVNDYLHETPTKHLVYVSSDELNSCFLLAKNNIVGEIYEEYMKIYNSIVDKLKKLQKYVQNDTTS